MVISILSRSRICLICIIQWDRVTGSVGVEAGGEVREWDGMEHK